MRHYRGFMADSARWARFRLRDDDVIITTPSKCGTTWMQTIVALLLRQRFDLPPIGTISPWLDMLLRTDEEVFAILDGQTDRRFIKTHTPLDGLPMRDSITYIAVVRHPLDVAMSDRDHAANMKRDHAIELRTAAVGEYERIRTYVELPDDASEFLRWFIDSDELPTGSGPNGLADFCEQARTYWDARDQPNVHLFHYSDMWNDLYGEMRRVATALNVSVGDDLWPELVSAATLQSMRSRATHTAPDAHLDLWRKPEGFFAVGGRRDWASLLSDDDLAHFEERLNTLAGDAAPWVVDGRSALP